MKPYPSLTYEAQPSPNPTHTNRELENYVFHFTSPNTKKFTPDVVQNNLPTEPPTSSDLSPISSVSLIEAIDNIPYDFNIEVDEEITPISSIDVQAMLDMQLETTSQPLYETSDPILSSTFGQPPYIPRFSAFHPVNTSTIVSSDAAAIASMDEDLFIDNRNSISVIESEINKMHQELEDEKKREKRELEEKQAQINIQISSNDDNVRNIFEILLGNEPPTNTNNPELMHLLHSDESLLYPNNITNNHEQNPFLKEISLKPSTNCADSGSGKNLLRMEAGITDPETKRIKFGTEKINFTGESRPSLGCEDIYSRDIPLTFIGCDQSICHDMKCILCYELRKNNTVIDMKGPKPCSCGPSRCVCVIKICKGTIMRQKETSLVRVMEVFIRLSTCIDHSWGIRVKVGPEKQFLVYIPVTLPPDPTGPKICPIWIDLKNEKALVECFQSDIQVKLKSLWIFWDESGCPLAYLTKNPSTVGFQASKNWIEYVFSKKSCENKGPITIGARQGPLRPGSVSYVPSKMKIEPGCITVNTGPVKIETGHITAKPKHIEIKKGYTTFDEYSATVHLGSVKFISESEICETEDIRDTPGPSDPNRQVSDQTGGQLNLNLHTPDHNLASLTEGKNTHSTQSEKSKNFDKPAGQNYQFFMNNEMESMSEGPDFNKFKIEDGGHSKIEDRNTTSRESPLIHNEPIRGNENYDSVNCTAQDQPGPSNFRDIEINQGIDQIVDLSSEIAAEQFNYEPEGIMAPSKSGTNNPNGFPDILMPEVATPSMSYTGPETGNTDYNIFGSLDHFEEIIRNSSFQNLTVQNAASQSIVPQGNFSYETDFFNSATHGTGAHDSRAYEFAALGESAQAIATQGTYETIQNASLQNLTAQNTASCSFVTPGNLSFTTDLLSSAACGNESQTYEFAVRGKSAETIANQEIHEEILLSSSFQTLKDQTTTFQNLQAQDYFNYEMENSAAHASEAIGTESHKFPTYEFETPGKSTQAIKTKKMDAQITISQEYINETTLSQDSAAQNIVSNGLEDQATFSQTATEISKELVEKSGENSADNVSNDVEMETSSEVPETSVKRLICILVSNCNAFKSDKNKAITTSANANQTTATISSLGTDSIVSIQEVESKDEKNDLHNSSKKEAENEENNNDVEAMEEDDNGQDEAGPGGADPDGAGQGGAVPDGTNQSEAGKKNSGKKATKKKSVGKKDKKPTGKKSDDKKATEKKKVGKKEPGKKVEGKNVAGKDTTGKKTFGKEIAGKKGADREGANKEGDNKEGDNKEGDNKEGADKQITSKVIDDKGTNDQGHFGQGYHSQWRHGRRHPRYYAQGHQGQGRHIKEHQGQGHYAQEHQGQGYYGQGYYAQGHQGQSYYGLGHQGQIYHAQRHQGQGYYAQGYYGQTFYSQAYYGQSYYNPGNYVQALYNQRAFGQYSFGQYNRGQYYYGPGCFGQGISQYGTVQDGTDLINGGQTNHQEDERNKVSSNKRDSALCAFNFAAERN